MRISLDKIISAMSIALDLTEISSSKNIDMVEEITNINYSEHKFLYHSRRTTYIALEIAGILNLELEKKKGLYVAAMLHDIGAANSFKSSHHSVNYITEHCRLGSSIVSSFPFYSGLSTIILYHHENYDGTGAFKIKGEFLPLESQIIRLADLIEVQYDDKIPVFLQKDKLIHWVEQNVDTIFSRQLVEAFLNLTSRDIFWFNLDNLVHMDFILSELAPKLDVVLDLQQFEDVAYLFSQIIDSASKFTARHSREIAELSYRVSKAVGYPEEKCLKMKIAGLLHDVGKLSIPSKILDKEGSLTPEEFSLIKTHAYYTKIILDRIENIPDISEWAASHHEKLNGRGYPRSLKEEEIGEESRILGACDIYTALIEDRPYRRGLSMDKAFAILDGMAEDGFICPKAVFQLKRTLC